MGRTTSTCQVDKTKQKDLPPNLQSLVHATRVSWNQQVRMDSAGILSLPESAACCLVAPLSACTAPPCVGILRVRADRVKCALRCYTQVLNGFLAKADGKDKLTALIQVRCTTPTNPGDTAWCNCVTPNPTQPNPTCSMHAFSSRPVSLATSRRSRHLSQRHAKSSA